MVADEQISKLRQEMEQQQQALANGRKAEDRVARMAKEAAICQVGETGGRLRTANICLV